MTTKELLGLDYRDEDNKYTLLRAAKQIPPLHDMLDNAIEIEHIEKVIHVMCKKYEMFIHIQQDPVSGGKYDIWSAQVFSTTTLKELQKVYGISLTELFLKLSIAIYSDVRKIKKGDRAKR